MIRTFAIVAIATAAIAGSQLGSASAAGIYDSGRSSFHLKNAPVPEAHHVGSANGGVWKTTDGGASWMTFDGLGAEQALHVPAIQKPLCTGKYC